MWLAAALTVSVTIVLAVVFAITHTTGSDAPSAVTPGNAPPQSNVLVSDGCGWPNHEGRYEPDTIQLACADGTVVANGLTWSRWGTTSATGHGTLNEVDCVPDCADGHDRAYPVTATLSTLVRAGNGKDYFTRLVLTLRGEHPDGSSTQTYLVCGYGPPAPYIPDCPPAAPGARTR
jgi:hypothetical protein